MVISPTTLNFFYTVAILDQRFYNSAYR